MSGTDTPEEPAFRPVEWLPPFRLEPAMLLDPPFEATLPAESLLPFALLRVEAAPLRIRPEAPEAAALAATAAELRRRLAASPPRDLSLPARQARWRLGAALAAAEGTESLARLGDIAGWQRAAAARRAAYLRAVSAGAPPGAAALADAVRSVPQAFRHLGQALPTQEALALLRPLGRICELGAGFGLFARALERAGMAVAASDASESGDVGLAFPVRKGVDAAATLAFFAARGPPPPLLMVWPQPEEGAWFATVFASAMPGQLIALASPEVEFCAGGGLEAAREAGDPAATRPGWLAAAELAARLRRDFEELRAAPVVSTGWPAVTTPLRLWRRR